MIEISEHSATDTSKTEKQVRVRNSCDDCAHVNICKYTQSYPHELRELQSGSYPPVMSIEISCNSYQNCHIPKDMEKTFEKAFGKIPIR